jgi:hypothetical protein
MASVQGQLVGVLDIGHHEPARRGGGDPQVDVPLDHDLLSRLIPGRIDLGIAPDRQADGFGEDQQRRDLHSPELPIALEPVDEVHRRGDIEVQPLGDVGRGEGRGDHGLGGHPADALDRDALLGG